MSIKLYTLLNLLCVSVLMTACNNSNQESTNHLASPSSTDDHKISLTINGNEFNNETITTTIHNEETAAMYSPTPIGNQKAIMFSASKDNKSINANFI